MILFDSEHVELATPFGQMRIHLFRPAAPGRYPGIVFFSEIFQVTGPIRRTAAMLAGHGYQVAVPEIYHEFEPAGTVLAYDQAGSDRGNQWSSRAMTPTPAPSSTTSGAGPTAPANSAPWASASAATSPFAPP